MAKAEAPMRQPNWPRLLSAEIEKAKARTFVYGEFDCMLFCADVVLTITGIDYAETLRGYNSSAEAARILSRYGSKADLITALLGAEPVHPSRAMRGDVVLAELRTIDEGMSECAGICLGHQSAFPKDIGLQLAPTLKAVRAWRIE
jgi:hypothetical protein